MGLLDAPSTSVTASQAAVLTSRLALGVDDAVLVVLGDSTGASRLRWVYLLTTWLASQFPAYTVNYWQWNDTGQSYDALGTANSSAVVQTGTGGRTDTGAGTTNGSSTITDTKIKASDIGRPVSGTGIPAGSFVGTVTDGTSFLLSSSATSQANVTATATGTVSIALGARVLNVYNGSVSGQIAGYPIATAARWALMVPRTPHLVIYSYGHNEVPLTGDLAYRLHAYPTCRKVQEVAPQAGLIITLQNPRATTDNGSGYAVERANDMARQRANAEMAAAEGYGVIDVQRRFLNDPAYETTLLDPDGLHPTTAGTQAWLSEVKKAFKASVNTRPAGPQARETWRFIPATQFVANEGSPVLGATNNAPAWAFDKDTQQGVVGSFDIPAHWSAYEVYTIWTVSTGTGYTGANNQCFWRMRWAGLGQVGFSAPINALASPGQTTLNGPNNGIGGASNTGGLFQSKATLMGSQALSALVGASAAITYRPLTLNIQRMAADALDTIAETTYMYGVLLVRAA